MSTSLSQVLHDALRPSTDRWVAAAIADLPTLLVDHAHCERKAAQTALRFIRQRPSATRLVTQLSRLAREELVHFEQVVRELERRGIPLVTLPSSDYARALFALVGQGAVDRAVDELLVCSIIEARSHERFVRLAAATPDEALRSLYGDLLEAEARHGALYVELAVAAGASEQAVALRLEALCAAEEPIVHRADQPLRMHAGG